ncbi:MAG TPA: hypothetical protein PKV66_04260 [Candidatus Pelethenecus sp.]|nr:hypothetical protein [Candidatus Pelethenecus sp.]
MSWKTGRLRVTHDTRKQKFPCARCGTRSCPSKHHILPRRHFKSSLVVYLCRDCHDEIERMIPPEPMPIPFYWRITRTFIQS